MVEVVLELAVVIALQPLHGGHLAKGGEVGDGALNHGGLKALNMDTLRSNADGKLSGVVQADALLLGDELG